VQNDPRPAPDAAEEPPRSPAHHRGAVAGVGRRAATGRLSGNAADWASCSGGLYRSAQRRDRRESRARGAEDGLLRDRGKPHRLHHLVAIPTVGEPEFRAPCGRCRVPRGRIECEVLPRDDQNPEPVHDGDQQHLGEHGVAQPECRRDGATAACAGAASATVAQCSPHREKAVGRSTARASAPISPNPELP